MYLHPSGNSCSGLAMSRKILWNGDGIWVTSRCADLWKFAVEQPSK